MPMIIAITIALTFGLVFAVKAYRLAQLRKMPDEHMTRNTGDIFVTNPINMHFLKDARPVSRTCTLSQPPYGAI